MRAVVVGEPGGPEVLEVREVERPAPSRREVLVRVHSSGVNRADLLQRQGRYPAPPGWPAEIPGLEFAGTVEEAGPDVRLWKPGDRVMGIVGGGGYAEHVVVHEREAVRIPGSVALEEAGGIPEVFFTAYDALVRRLRVGLGESLLIHAVGSGVGTAALQIAGAAGLRTLGTSRTPAKVERAETLGLGRGLVAAGDWPERILDATEGRGVDAILDLVGGAYLAGNLRVLAEGGRQVVVGVPSGSRSEIDLRSLMRARGVLVGTVLRARPLEEKISLAREFERRLVPLLEAGGLRPVIDRRYPPEEAAEAHRRMEANENFGKLVLVWE